MIRRWLVSLGLMLAIAAIWVAAFVGLSTLIHGEPPW